MVPFESHYFIFRRFDEVEFIYVLLVLLIKTPFVSLIDCSRQRLSLNQSLSHYLSSSASFTLFPSTSRQHLTALGA